MAKNSKAADKGTGGPVSTKGPASTSTKEPAAAGSKEPAAPGSKEPAAPGPKEPVVKDVTTGSGDGDQSLGSQGTQGASSAPIAGLDAGLTGLGEGTLALVDQERSNDYRESTRGLEVTSTRDGFRRAGRTWSKKPTIVRQGEINEEQLLQLLGEPKLLLRAVDLGPAPVETDE